MYCKTIIAKFYWCIKFEVSSFTRSKFTEEDLKFKKWNLDPDHTTFGGILLSVRWDLPRSIRTPNLKFLASPISDLRKGV